MNDRFRPDAALLPLLPPEDRKRFEGADAHAVLSDLARAKVTFQARSIAAAVGGRAAVSAPKDPNHD